MPPAITPKRFKDHTAAKSKELQVKLEEVTTQNKTAEMFTFVVKAFETTMAQFTAKLEELKQPETKINLDQKAVIESIAILQSSIALQLDGLNKTMVELMKSIPKELTIPEIKIPETKIDDRPWTFVINRNNSGQIESVTAKKS